MVRKYRHASNLGIKCRNGLLNTAIGERPELMSMQARRISTRTDGILTYGQRQTQLNRVAASPATPRTAQQNLAIRARRTLHRHSRPEHRRTNSLHPRQPHTVPRPTPPPPLHPSHLPTPQSLPPNIPRVLAVHLHAQHLRIPQPRNPRPMDQKPPRGTNPPHRLPQHPTHLHAPLPHRSAAALHLKIP